MRKNIEQTGFTLLELLIVIAISMIFLAASIPVYGNWQSMSQNKSAQAELLQVLRRAREYSIAGYNNSSHGVYMEENTGDKDRIVYYQGDSYASRDDSYDLAVLLPLSLNLLSEIEDKEVVFSQDRGEPSATGTISLLSEGQEFFRLSINGQGIITVN